MLVTFKFCLTLVNYGHRSLAPGSQFFCFFLDFCLFHLSRHMQSLILEMIDELSTPLFFCYINTYATLYRLYCYQTRVFTLKGLD
uniref:Uncharacterized protein n=1 Tax=Anguilla anguilla TaxID=7936 RepID=A0A0E9REU8_ANGAN